jgi:hypothetical protein
MAVVIHITDVVVSEGDGFADLVLRLTESSSETVSLSWTTSDGNATASQSTDYVGAIGTVAFAPGETTQTIRVAITDDGGRSSSC